MKYISKLLGLRTLVTLSITGALIYGFVADKITSEQFMTIATMIFTFYFAKKEQESIEDAKELEIKQETKELGGN